MGENTLMTEEHFVKIQDYPNYAVSNLGRVVNVKLDRDMRTHVDKKTGNLAVTLSSHNISRKIPVKKLVAQAFFQNFQRWSEVFLLSDDPTDCSVGNLTLVRPSKKPGKKILIVELEESYNTSYDVAKRINGSSGVIQKILLGLGRTHKGYSFAYIDSGDVSD